MSFKTWLYALSAAMVVGIFGLIYQAEKHLSPNKAPAEKFAGGSATGNAIEATAQRQEEPVASTQKLAIPQSSSSTEVRSSTAQDSAASEFHSELSLIRLRKNCGNSLQEPRVLCGSPLELPSDSPLAGLRLELQQGYFSVKEILYLRKQSPFELTIASQGLVGISGPIEWKNLSTNASLLKEKEQWHSVKDSLHLFQCRLLPADNDQSILASKVLFQEQGELILLRSAESEDFSALFHCPSPL